MSILNFTPFPELNTERLFMRQLVDGDKKELFFIRSDPQINNYIDRPRPSNIEDVNKFISMINRGIKKNEWIYWVITLKNDCNLIGTICLWNINKSNSTGEIGYELHPEYQGIGIMNEAIKCILDFGFNIIKLKRIDAYTHKDNLASTKLLQKHNFHLISDRKDDENENSIIFSLYNPINKF